MINEWDDLIKFPDYYSNLTFPVCFRGIALGPAWASHTVISHVSSLFSFVELVSESVEAHLK